MRVPIAGLLLLVAACSRATPTAPAQDALLAEHVRAGQLALRLERPAEAVTQFRAALARATARDDAAAIGDVGFDLALAELAANQPAAALTDIHATEAELAQRNAGSFPALSLVEATALYRSGAMRAADAIAARVEAQGDGEIAARATFLRGLIADETGDQAGLEAAVQRLGAPAVPSDAAELEARLALRQGDAGRAAADAGRAVDLRRTQQDYRGLARSLAVAARAALAGGDRQAAAGFYLRAGSSAAAQGDAVAARPWLSQAMRLTTDPAVIADARAGLATLGP